MSDAAGYETLNEAVYYAALATREKYGNKHEAISVIFEKDGRFHYTPPLSEKESSKNVKAQVTIPKGGLRFVVHNHPPGSENEKFSDTDIGNAERLGVPSAIIFGSDPTIRIFTPGATRIEREGTSAKAKRVSLGDEFAGTMQ